MKPRIAGRVVRPFACLLYCITAACSGSAPTAPAPAPPTEPTLLPQGRYIVTAGTGSDPSCTGRMDSWGFFGPNVGGIVTVVRDGDGWSAHAASTTDGDVGLRLRRATGTGADTQISGEIRGTLLHFLDRFSTPPRSVSFAGARPGEVATLQGTFQPPIGAVFGSATGEITFTHSSGTTVVCQSVVMIIGPQ